MMENLIKIARRAKKASYELAVISAKVKNKALLEMAKALEAQAGNVLSENKRDLAAAKGLSLALVDRLTLNKDRICSMALSLREIVSLKDPVGQVINSWTRPNGLRIQKVRVPIGVTAIIYESRPNVTSDCIGLCLKSGNASILKGGKEAINTNRAVYRILSSAAVKNGIPAGAINFIDSTGQRAVVGLPIAQATRRGDVLSLLSLSDYIDLVIPRGGEGLIRFVQNNSRIPVIKHYKGVCHVYVDRYADLQMAREIAFNAKVQRPGVCNAMETLLAHKDIADKFLPEMIRRFREAKVEIRGCPRTCKIVKGIKKAKEIDWSTEYLDLILSVKVVESLEAAIEHINHYGSRHSDSIVTRNKANAIRFLNMVDSACVYANASTRFTDGYEFGFGAEIGISTDKLHARGPMALEELTTYKYKVFGNGQVRK